MSPREYDAKVDRCTVWNLMQQGFSSAEIARKMGKDPAWVCRIIQELHSNLVGAFPRPNEDEIVTKNLTNFENLFALAAREIEANGGRVRVLAIRAAFDILRQKCEYEFRVGQVAPRTKSADGFDLGEKPLFPPTSKSFEG